MTELRQPSIMDQPGPHYEPHLDERGLCQCSCEQCYLRRADLCPCLECPCRGPEDHKRDRL
jgi:hypothetical protein